MKKTLLTALFLTLSVLLHAQASTPRDSLRSQQLEETVVTSSPKDHVSLRRQALSFTSFTSADATRMGFSAPKSVSAIAPNLYMPTYGSRLTSAVYVRGVGSRSGSPAVGLYVDDIPFADKSMYDFELTDVDRIDLVRGPAGTLYGRGAMGGLLRIYTPDPSRHASETTLRLSASTRDGGLGASLQTILHPLPALSLSLSGFARRADGFWRNAYTGARADRSSLGGGRVRAVLTPAGRWRYDLTASYQYSDEGSNPYALLSADDEAYFPEKDGLRFTDLAGHITQNRQSSYRRGLFTSGLKTSWQGEGLSLTSITAVEAFRDRLFMDQDYIAADIFSLTQKQRYGSLSEELTLRSTGTGRWQWTTGLFLQTDRKRTTCPVVFYEDGVSYLNTVFRSVMPNFITLTFQDDRLPFFARLTSPGANAALFHQSTFRDVFTPGLSLTAGLRMDYDRHSLRLTSPSEVYRYNFALQMPTYGLDLNRDFTASAGFSGRSSTSSLQLLPSVSLTYELPSSLGRVYGSVSRGYRSAGYNMENYSDLSQSLLRRNIMLGVGEYSEETIRSLPLSDASKEAAVGGMSAMIAANLPAEVAADALAYEPETSWNHELGAHLNPSDGFSLDVAAFHQRTHNLQLSRFSPSGMGRETVNAGQSRTFGLELSLSQRLTTAPSARGNEGSFVLSASYGLARARFVDKAKSTSYVASSLDGNHVPFAPEHTLSLSSEASLLRPARTFLRELSLSLLLRGEGPIYWDEANTLSRPVVLRLDARISALLTSRLRLTLRGENLTHRRYCAFSFVSMHRRYAQYGTPTHFTLEASLRL